MGKSVIAAMDDILFSSRIDSTAKFNKVNVDFVKSRDDLFEKARMNNASLILLDLDFKEFGPMRTISQLKKDAVLRNATVIGYLEEHNTETKAEAVGAGVDAVMLKEELDGKLSKILS
jgi:PleD family two-component response regulator